MQHCPHNETQSNHVVTGAYILIRAPTEELDNSVLVSCWFCRAQPGSFLTKSQVRFPASPEILSFEPSSAPVIKYTRKSLNLPGRYWLLPRESHKKCVYTCIYKPYSKWACSFVTNVRTQCNLCSYATKQYTK